MNEFEKKTILLRRGDWEKLRQHSKTKGLKPSHIIRHIVSVQVDLLSIDASTMDDLIKEIMI